MTKKTRNDCLAHYRKVLKADDTDAMRELCRTDLFFLLVIGFDRYDVNCDWLFDRCNEVQSAPNGYLDLWARDHYKSTIITYALTIQDILRNPEITIGIFSHVRPIAKSFMSQIKRELETNRFLRDLFPDILYENPKKEAPKWSLNEGLIVKRKTNPNNATLEAYGLVDGQPTSKHFDIMVYDDVVTLNSVTNKNMIDKVTEAWELSLNLASKGGILRMIGTRYSNADTYKTIIERKVCIPRIHPATDDGTVDGEPVFLSKEILDKKRQAMGSFVFACQMLQNPVEDNKSAMMVDWVKFYHSLKTYKGMNIYMLIDPASGKGAGHDYTVVVIIGLGADGNYYLIDGIRDRLSLVERTEAVFRLYKKYHPIAVGYEKYGKDSDIEHIEYEMERLNFRFKITPLGGGVAKNQRIMKLAPVLEAGRFYMPQRLLFPKSDGTIEDFMVKFKEELSFFPFGEHDDILDVMSRIVDNNFNTSFPLPQREKKRVNVARSQLNFFEGSNTNGLGI